MGERQVRESRVIRAWKRIPLNGWAAIAIAAALHGCQAPLHQQRIEARTRCLERTARTIEQVDADRDVKLQRMLKILADHHQQDMTRTERMPATIGDEIRRDVDHWERQQPILRRGIEDQMRGNPRNIERTLPEILY